LVRVQPGECESPAPRLCATASNAGLSSFEGVARGYAGFDEDAGVFRIVTVWETREQGQAYNDDHVMPAVRDVIGEGQGAPPTREAVYELHNVARP
jgi:hypothetical protein